MVSGGHGMLISIQTLSLKGMYKNDGRASARPFCFGGEIKRPRNVRGLVLMR